MIAQLLPSFPARVRTAVATPAAAAVFLACLLVAGCSGGGDAALDAEIAKQLEALGAIVVKGADQKFVASVNLSPIAAAEPLDKALRLLPKLARLQALDLSRTPVRDDQLTLVNQSIGLRSLALAQTGITDAGLKSLGALADLNALNLASTQVTDAGLPSLAKMAQLKILDLSGTGVRTALAPLASLTQLDWLVLRNLQLSDEALPQLAACRQLKRLSLQQTAYAAASLQALRSAAGQLSVDE